MQEWLDNNDILMYSTNNEGKSVIAERFIKTLKAKIYKKWQLVIANLILVVWIKYWRNAIVLIIILLVKKHTNGDYSAMTGKIETNPKVSKFKVGDRIRITNYKNIFSKGYTDN